ncbi:HAD family hydrolase [Pseudosulfitobacter pseudonitzschiae]|uniref:HAD family hydrolase n=1 Tax=Pseudosulfitobacter pseudonitzschiae TaxID=1402135 RepID=A0A073IZB7_9RHOB|nr:HAD family hydrolase [Pseudosulfitobacter pseudonitzschiae]KEJ95024.1 HAD family hydrolase [Pseudosulfitobacter pseudonitzschiae]MBM1816520.1 HAD family hydrolase [Pseudosulfitobacter pseudonitzschiae]MBM1833118.1 HAD family hydrolase [Pseudosulfitobacter pseudonitzschiae]MBM1837986.1 HAD family hydrolase [Pseudosulfitobacter pseudonitzschiae]MBM1843247.1 HAD family hydrolase [Pseudosulfitobacter pseudonitzschiae]
MAQTLTTIAFDADDTLWHNERFFKLTQERFAELLAPYTDGDALMSRLLEAERRNIRHYGFGIKGFMLSMIETALDVTDNAVPGAVIAELIAAGQDMLQHPVDLLPHAAEALRAAQAIGPVLLITKGDLLDQERKIAQSGLGDVFDAVQIVSAKTPETYARIFDAYDGAARGMMIGNSMASDVRPMLEAGGWGVHVPHDLLWDLEHAERPEDHPRFHEIPDLGALPDLLSRTG